MKDKHFIFGQRIKELRIKNNIMQKDIADKLNVDPRSIRQYESGSREPSFNVICFFSDLFNVSSDFLLGLTDDPKRYYK